MKPDEWWEPNLERWAERGIQYKGPARAWLRTAKLSHRGMVGLGIAETPEGGAIACYAVDEHFWRRCDEQPPRPTEWLKKLFCGALSEALYEAGAR